MTAAWPGGGLATAFIEQVGYKEGILGDPTVRSTMDSGPPKARTRYSAVVYTFEGSIGLLASADVDALFAFYDTTLVFGSLPFTWVHPRTAAAATFKFQERPAITGTQGVKFQVSVKLMILPP